MTDMADRLPGKGDERARAAPLPDRPARLCCVTCIRVATGNSRYNQPTYAMAAGTACPLKPAELYHVQACGAVSYVCVSRAQLPAQPVCHTCLQAELCNTIRHGT